MKSQVGQKVKRRESGIELFRIIAMLTIVAHHYVVNSGIMPLLHEEGFTHKALFYYLFGMWGKIGINCFVLITGYFMCQSNIKLRKFLKLFLEVVFYNSIIYIILAYFGYYTFSIRSIIHIWPISSVATSFTPCFLLFYLCIPFLNILIKNIDMNQHFLLLLLVLGIYTFMGTIPTIGVSMNYVSWFCVLYFIASFIRFYGGSISFMRNSNWLLLSIVSIFLSMLSVVALVWVRCHLGLNIPSYYFVADSNKIFALITAICTFIFFKNLNLSYSKLINTIAASTFGVLLIHAHSSAMRQWLWHDFVDVRAHFFIDYYVIYSFFVVLTIFLICIMIDYIRIQTIEKISFKYIDKLLIKAHLSSSK